jgi:hypothetical protein
MDLVAIINLICGLGIVVFAIVSIFWKLSFPMFIVTGLYFIWMVFSVPFYAALEPAERSRRLAMLPNLALGLGLAIPYSYLLMKDEDYIQQNQMPDNWDVYNIVLCVFLALHAALLQASNFFVANISVRTWLPVAAYACILLAYLFLIIQYMLSTHFHTSG